MSLQFTPKLMLSARLKLSVTGAVNVGAVVGAVVGAPVGAGTGGSDCDAVDVAIGAGAGVEVVGDGAGGDGDGGIAGIPGPDPVLM